MFLESNHGGTGHDTYKSLLAVGCIDSLSTTYNGAFSKLEEFHNEYQDWIFGYLGYDLKNDLEDLKSKNPDGTQFPDLCFYVPEVIFELASDHLLIHSYHASELDIKKLLDKIIEHQIQEPKTVLRFGKLMAKDSKASYLIKAQNFLDHIHRGDIYEANFCTEFFAENVSLDTLKAFKELNDISEPPFAVYARLNSYHVMSASPERYLKKVGSQLISQPIKGTAKRSQHFIEDEDLKEQLFNDPKERSENVMIVDLVRNDLSKIAKKGTVEVEELYGIYSFKQVHQMISTVTATVEPGLSFIDVLKATFPMGSMTGAPKISAMNIIEKNESFKRGLYSGAIGYIKPDGDFDFNVVIRSILYNTENKYLSFSVGSAITTAALPEKEYEECLLKANAMIEVLSHQGISFD
ncbi:para-aminobenzoate synthase aminase component [Nonlabens ulvanivorans]|nr:anthranilate synthase component I family protein [Nonlabens ulvanivorans]GAK91021.1 para-aminobenzoate synthase aminase component [Nonlabens ulvanivorans]